MNANEIITRMLAIEVQVKEHENALTALRSEGQGLFGEFESWRLTFASSVAPKNTTPKTDAKDDLKTALKLVIRRSVLKARLDGHDKHKAFTIGETAALRFTQKRRVELPVWVADWSKKLIEKTFPQSEVETPAAEFSTKEILPEPAGAVEAPVKKRKKK
jgi:hypothetical protein